MDRLSVSHCVDLRIGLGGFLCVNFWQSYFHVLWDIYFQKFSLS